MLFATSDITDSQKTFGNTSKPPLRLEEIMIEQPKIQPAPAAPATPVPDIHSMPNLGTKNLNSSKSAMRMGAPKAIQEAYGEYTQYKELKE